MDGIEAVTTTALGMALDAAALRHQAIANNIANANTPGYQPLRVSFESQLDAARASLHEGGRIDPHDLEGINATTARIPAGGAVPIRLDTEVANMAQNLVHYQTLIKVLNRHFSILASAASDGKR